MARNRKRQDPVQAGPVKGEFIAPPEELTGADVTPEALQTQYEFPGTGTISIACKV